MVEEESLLKTIANALVALGLTPAAQSKVLNVINNAERVHGASKRDIVSGGTQGMHIDFSADLTNRGVCSNYKYCSEEARRHVFRVNVDRNGMTFKLLKNVDGVKFVVWRDRSRQTEVQAGTLIHTVNNGSEGIIIDGGTLSRSIYISSTCFRFASKLCYEGVLGDLTEDNLLAGEIVYYIERPDRNSHPRGFYNNMFQDHAL